MSFAVPEARQFASIDTERAARHDSLGRAELFNALDRVERETEGSRASAVEALAAFCYRSFGVSEDDPTSSEAFKQFAAALRRELDYNNRDNERHDLQWREFREQEYPRLLERIARMEERLVLRVAGGAAGTFGALELARFLLTGEV